MPASYYCLDNFFKKVTNMESPRKNNDCYFYYYSTCTKGDNCTFRHEPSALGCETVCSFWKEGKCINVRCNFRHMELRKNRKAIPCYWESQPGGCLKPHCPFLHQNQIASLTESEGEASDIKAQELKKENAMKGSEKNFESPVVDPLVVNFEEESDNESTPTFSPIKCQRAVKVKTLEEIKLEKIQAESAAYYSYQDALKDSDCRKILPEADDLRQRILSRFNSGQNESEIKQDFEIYTLKDIRKRKMKNPNQTPPNDGEEQIIKKAKLVINNKIQDTDLSNVKIKTLSEIRAEKAKRSLDKCKQEEEEISSTFSEVTSTSNYDGFNNTTTNKTQCVATIQPTKRLKRSADPSSDTSDRKPKLIRRYKTTINEMTDVQENETEANLENNTVINKKDRTDNDNLIDTKLDEVLLLEDEELEENVTLKEEDDILKNIDALLNE